METADSLKEKFKCKTDAELGALFRRGDRAVSVWRKEGLPAAIERKALEMLGLSHHPNSNFITVKVYNTISCGHGIDPDGREEIGVISVPTEEYRNSMVFVRVKGRSMEPVIREGAYVGIDTHDKEIVSGEVYAVCSVFEGAVIKRIIVENDCLVQVSYNSEFEPVTVKDVPDWYIIGRAVWVMNKLKKGEL